MHLIGTINSNIIHHHHEETQHIQASSMPINIMESMKINSIVMITLWELIERILKLMTTTELTTCHNHHRFTLIQTGCMNHMVKSLLIKIVDTIKDRVLSMVPKMLSFWGKDNCYMTKRKPFNVNLRLEEYSNRCKKRRDRMVTKIRISHHVMSLESRIDGSCLSCLVLPSQSF